MKKITLQIILFHILTSPLSYSQQIRANKRANPSTPEIIITVAEQQQWSGGVAGKMGSIYQINFTTYPDYKGAVPDTIWIGEKYFPIKIFDGSEPTGEDANCKLLKGKNRWTYSFSVNDDESTDYPDLILPVAKETKLKPPLYQGAAAISYTYNHKRKLKAIISFKQLEPINYP